MIIFIYRQEGQAIIMNFQWNTDYDQEKKLEERKKIRKEAQSKAANHYFPHFFKYPGIAIISGTVCYKIYELNKPAGFATSSKAPDLMILALILAGVSLEAMSKARVETAATIKQRTLIMAGVATVCCIYLLANISAIWDFLWQ